MSRKKRYLQLDLREGYLETEFSRSWLGGAKTSFRQLLDTLQRAGANRKIELILLCFRGQSLSWSQIQELSGLIEGIRAQGKPCWAFLEEGQLPAYRLAATCDRIILPPSVILNLLGFRLEQIFFREFLDEWGIQPEFLARGKYKSATEIFTENQMSEPAREMMTALLEQTRDDFVSAVAKHRELSPARVLELIDDAPHSAARALEAGLVDELAYDDQLEGLIEDHLGPARKAKPNRFKKGPSLLSRLLHFRRPRIAYLVAEGLILGGPRRPFRNRPTVDGRTLREQLEKARENKKIQAIVLRINSPGGDATVSDLIWREIVRTNEKKPVIASLGDRAASGGYYLASAARRRLAMPGTLTGSIGVIGGKLSARRLLEHFKLHGQSIDMGKRSGFFSPLREQTDSEKEALARQLKEVYELFLDRVCLGTGKPKEEIVEHAEGRIWSGSDAVRLGLVNEIGGIHQAFRLALKECGLPEDTRFHTISFRQKRSLLATLLEN